MEMRTKIRHIYTSRQKGRKEERASERAREIMKQKYHQMPLGNAINNDIDSFRIPHPIFMSFLYNEKIYMK